MKVGVLGAGAIGSMFGGLLRHGDPQIEVTLVGRGAHGEAVRRRGYVQLDGPWGTRCVNMEFSFDPARLAGCDFVLLCVKSHGTRQALEEAAAHFGNATVITIQNGINDALLQEHVSADRLTAAMTATNAAVTEPGTVSLQLDGVTMVGPVRHEASRAAAAAVELLRKTGLRVESTDKILGVRYNKLAMNALGYASCISASNFITEAIAYKPWRRYVGLPLAAECLAVFEAAGIELGPIPGRPGVDGLAKLLRRFDMPVVGRLIGFGARWLYNRRPIVFSLYQDLLRGKPTEVEHINGEIVRLACAHGGQAPRNELVVQLVREVERKGPGKFLDREEVIGRFARLADRLPADGSQ